MVVRERGRSLLHCPMRSVGSCGGVVRGSERSILGNHHVVSKEPAMAGMDGMGWDGWMDGMGEAGTKHEVQRVESSPYGRPEMVSYPRL